MRRRPFSEDQKAIAVLQMSICQHGAAAAIEIHRRCWRQTRRALKWNNEGVSIGAQLEGGSDRLLHNRD